MRWSAWVLVVLLLAVGCGRAGAGGVAPKRVETDARKWVVARVRGEMPVLERLSTPSHYQAIRRSSSPLLEEYDRLARPQVTVISVTETAGGLTMVVDAAEHGETVRHTLELELVDGDWRVAGAEFESVEDG